MAVAINRFPPWDRPGLRTGQLEGEDRGLALRNLTIGQARADLITALASTGGDTLGQCQRIFGEAAGIDPGTIGNAVMGRAPIYGPLLEALYGPEPGGALLTDWYRLDGADWGPMEALAREAGLIPRVDYIDDRGPAPAPAPPPAEPLVSGYVEPAPVDLGAAEAAAHFDIHSDTGQSTTGAGGPLPPHPPAPASTAPAPAAPAPGLDTAVQPAGGADAGSAAGEGSHTTALHAVAAGEGAGTASGPTPLPPLGLRPLPFTGPPVRVDGGLEPALDVLAQLAQRESGQAKEIADQISRYFALIDDLERARDAASARAAAARQAYDLLDALRAHPAQQVAA